MQDEMINQYIISLEGNSEIEMEFEMLHLILTESKRPGFKNKFRDIADYAEMRFSRLASYLENKNQ
jgi:hypothetical protein